MKKKDNQLPFLISGKIGDLVGRVVNGKQYFSKLPRPRKGTPTMRELETRRNFFIAVRFAKALLPVARIYDEQNGRKGFHKLTSHIMRHAIKGQHPDQQIDFSRVVLGEGDLPNPDKYLVKTPVKGLLEFTWSLERMRRGTSKIDRIFTLVYCEKRHACRYEIFGSERHDRLYLMDVSDFSGEKIEVWFGFTSAAGTRVSTSIYAGSIEVS